MDNDRVLVYDRAILPEGATMKEIFKKYKEFKVIDYDSFGTDKKPFIINESDLNDNFDGFVFNDLHIKKGEENGE